MSTHAILFAGGELPSGGQEFALSVFGDTVRKSASSIVHLGRSLTVPPICVMESQVHNHNSSWADAVIPLDLKY